MTPSPLDAQTALCDTWHRSFHPDRNSHSSHPDVSLPEFCPANVLPYPDVSHLEFFPPDIPPGYITSGILSAVIPSTWISHIRNLIRRHSIHPDISHPEFCPASVQPSPDISHPEFCSADVPPSPDISCPADVPPFSSSLGHFLEVPKIPFSINLAAIFFFGEQLPNFSCF